ncbi:hypothetical protein F2Q69_00059441 [Brassica cretica]|uniref:Uncharacterized protein n=1 Tax=Brassica cretica TaxID=69181 RepID=A0A8S9RFW0_BRACR|nr:hypothetical protein F2Q69_00059441 [Brassica cretica]
MTHSFPERIGQPEVDLANDWEESVPFNVHDATSILEFSSSQMYSMLFRDSLDKSHIVVKPLSDGAMVSQILWLGMKDVFTQIAKDVVGQAFDRGRRSPRGLLPNHCGVSCGMTAFSDVAEGKERQKPASRRDKKMRSIRL